MGAVPYLGPYKDPDLENYPDVTERMGYWVTSYIVLNPKP